MSMHFVWRIIPSRFFRLKGYCLLNHLFMHRPKKTLKLRVTGFYEGNSPETGEFPPQRARNAENVSIWWRHHDLGDSKVISFNYGWLISLPQFWVKTHIWGVHPNLGDTVMGGEQPNGVSGFLTRHTTDSVRFSQQILDKGHAGTTNEFIR